jgi:acetyl/propionyl-CoA carboxylase alpha subunit
MANALRGAGYEAASAFGDNRVYIEKYFQHPRHIEVQILADAHGNAIHLGERECSIQRRHQKLVEESPAPNLKPDVRQRITETAVKIARAVGYQNAGTVEFLSDERGNFYFLEINARLQVEHPVTEWVTGLDLAKLQIQIASGQKLPHSQEQIRFSGVAMECRIYAEDFENNFYPSGGRLTEYDEPAGPGVRVDSGVTAGSQISLYYDPLIAKLIVWGKDRQEAMVRMKRALNEYKISGLVTTVGFHKLLMENEKFQKGELSTQFLAEEFSAGKPRSAARPIELEKLAVSAALIEYARAKPRMDYLPSNGHQPKSNWKTQSRQMALRMPE